MFALCAFTVTVTETGGSLISTSCQTAQSDLSGSSRAGYRRSPPGHGLRSLLRPGLRLRVHPDYLVHGGGPDAARACPGPDPASADVVGLVRLHLAGQPDPRRRGSRPG